MKLCPSGLPGFVKNPHSHTESSDTYGMTCLNEQRPQAPCGKDTDAHPRPTGPLVRTALSYGCPPTAHRPPGQDCHVIRMPTHGPPAPWSGLPCPVSPCRLQWQRQGRNADQRRQDHLGSSQCHLPLRKAGAKKWLAGRQRGEECSLWGWLPLASNSGSTTRCGAFPQVPAPS